MNTQPDGPTQKQIHVLYDILHYTEWPRIKTMSQREAWELIRDHSLSWRGYPATDRQKQRLMLRGLWREGMTRGEASKLIGGLQGPDNASNAGREKED
jgi:hypothetical protein